MAESIDRTGRTLAGGVYGFDDLRVGDAYATGSTTVTVEHIDRFADLSGDNYALHLDESFARELGFPQRIAHGLLILSLADGLKNQAPVKLDAIASLGWDIRFSRPVFIGDTIRADLVVADLRTTRTPDRGVVTLDVNVDNQRGETVQRGTNRLMLRGAGTDEPAPEGEPDS